MTNLEQAWKDFSYFVATHGPRFFVAGVTGVLTYLAGWFLTSQPVYAITLVLLAEGLSLYWPYRMEAAQSYGTRRNVNWAGVAQWAAASIGVILAWVSIIITDLATATIIASNAGKLTGWLQAFEVVPLWAQEVVVYVLPVLAVSHGILLSVFYVASPEAATARINRQAERETTQTIREARNKARAEEAKARAAAYERNAITEARKLGEAKGASMVQSDFTEPLLALNAEAKAFPKVSEAEITGSLNSEQE